MTVEKGTEGVEGSPTVKKTGRFINQFISYYQRKSLQDNSYHFITHFRILVNDIVKQAQLS